MRRITYIRFETVEAFSTPRKALECIREYYHGEMTYLPIGSEGLAEAAVRGEVRQTLSDIYEKLEVVIEDTSEMTDKQISKAMTELNKGNILTVNLGGFDTVEISTIEVQ